MLFTLRQKKVTTNLFSRVSFAGLLNLATSDAELCTNVVTVICSSIFLNRIIIEASKYSRYGFALFQIGRLLCRCCSVFRWNSSRCKSQSSMHSRYCVFKFRFIGSHDGLRRCLLIFIPWLCSSHFCLGYFYGLIWFGVQTFR